MKLQRPNNQTDISEKSLEAIKSIVQVEVKKVVLVEVKKVVQEEVKKIAQVEIKKVVQDEVKKVVQVEVEKVENRLIKRIDIQTKVLTGAIATLGNNVVSIDEFEELKRKVEQIDRRTRTY